MDFNPLLPGFRENPYPTYETMRAEGAVHRAEPFGVYVVCRYDEVQQVLKNPAVFSSAKGVQLPVHGEPQVTVISADPPEHTQLRNLVNVAFTPRMVADLEPRIREITAGLLDAVTSRGSTDIVADLAVPLPITIIAELLGIETDRLDDFKRWSTAAVASDDMSNDEEKAENGRLYNELVDYLDAAIDNRRASGDRGTDLISGLLRAETETQALTAAQLIAFSVLLLIAGNETTTNLIGNAIVALLEHPEQLEMLRRDPSLIPNAVEEALRYDAPVQFLPRTASQEVTIDGITIPKDAQVFPIFASANRDERRYPDGEGFDITRNAQGHVAFGHGIHFCLGAPLARLEGRIALEQVIERMPELRRADAKPLDYGTSMFLRGPRSLPLRFQTHAVTPP